MPSIGRVKTLVKGIVQKNPDVSIGMWGPPGVGKSEIVLQIANELKYKFQDVRLSQFEPSELRGIPARQGDKTVWLRPDFLPDTDEPTILMLDEFPCAEPAVQNAALRIVLDRSLDNWQAPKNTRILLAGNRKEDFAYVNEPSAPFKTRLVNFIVEPSFTDFRNHAKTFIAPQILSFLEFKPELLLKINPDAYASPTPRTWVMLSKLLRGLLGEDWAKFSKQDMLSINDISYGCVGEGAAVEFCAYFETFARIDVKGIVEEGKIPSNFNKMELSTQYATLYAVLFYCDKLAFTQKVVQNLLRFLTELPPEFRMKFMVDIRPIFIEKATEVDEGEFKPIIREIVRLLNQR